MHNRLARVERNIQDWNRTVIEHENSANDCEERVRQLKKEGKLLYSNLLQSFPSIYEWKKLFDN